MPGSAGNSLFIPTGPAPDYNALIQQDPWYKQQLQWLADQQKSQMDLINQGRTFADQNFNLDTQQAQLNYDPNWDYGLGTAEANAALAKQKAAHDNEMQAEYLNEWLSGRGLHDSGQQGLEQGEREYQYGTVNQGIDIGLAGTQADVAHAKTTAQNNLANLLAQIELEHNQALAGYSTQEGALPAQYAKLTGQAAFDTFERLKADGSLNAPGINAMWDEESGLYVTQDGQYYNANGIKTNYVKPVTSVPQATPSYTPIIDAAQAQQPQYPIPDPFSYESAAGRTGKMLAF